jgi:Flp pilus assembly protein TadD
MTRCPSNTIVPTLSRGRPFQPNAASVRDRGTYSRNVDDSLIKLYEQARRRDPHNHFLLIDLAREYGVHLRLFDADRVLLRVLELYPRNARIRSMVAATYAMVGCPLQAIAHYRLALDLDPQHPESAAIRARLSSLKEMCGV